MSLLSVAGCPYAEETADWQPTILLLLRAVHYGPWLPDSSGDSSESPGKPWRGGIIGKLSRPGRISQVVAPTSSSIKDDELSVPLREEAKVERLIVTERKPRKADRIKKSRGPRFLSHSLTGFVSMLKKRRRPKIAFFPTPHHNLPPNATGSLDTAVAVQHFDNTQHIA